MSYPYEAVVLPIACRWQCYFGQSYTYYTTYLCISNVWLLYGIIMVKLFSVTTYHYSAVIIEQCFCLFFFYREKAVPEKYRCRGAWGNHGRCASRPFKALTRYRNSTFVSLCSSVGTLFFSPSGNVHVIICFISLVLSPPQNPLNEKFRGPAPLTFLSNVFWGGNAIEILPLCGWSLVPNFSSGVSPPIFI